MITLHNAFKLVFGFCMVNLCRFNYFTNIGPSGPSTISTSSVPESTISAYGLQSAGNGMYYYPKADLYYSGDKFFNKGGSGYQAGNTLYGLYEGDVIGFNRDSEANTYTTSPAYLNTLKKSNTPYVPFAAPKAPASVLGYNPSLLSSIYQPASANNNLLASMPEGAVMYGAGRFLDNGLLNMPIQFTMDNTNNDQTGSDS